MDGVGPCPFSRSPAAIVVPATFSGRVPDQGLAGEELMRLAAELRTLGWLPDRQEALS